MAKPTILSRPPKSYPKRCTCCGADLDKPVGLCGKCAKATGVDLKKRWKEVTEAKERYRRRMRAHREESRRYLERRQAENEQRLIENRKEAAARRNRAVFPRASDVTVTRADGTTSTVPAYRSPAALRKAAPERLPIPEEMRSKILARDGYACRYCGNPDGPFEMEHVVPVVKGGATSMSNLVTACRPCNAKKGTAVWKPRPLPRSTRRKPSSRS